MRARTSYTEEFKSQAIIKALEIGIPAAVKETDVPRKTLWRWVDTHKKIMSGEILQKTKTKPESYKKACVLLKESRHDLLVELLHEEGKTVSSLFRPVVDNYILKRTINKTKRQKESHSANIN